MGVAMSVRCVDRLPKRAGSYNASVNGVMFCVAYYIEFDGTAWVFDLDGSKPEDYYWFPGEDD